MDISKFNDVSAQLSVKVFSSSAYGTSKSEVLDMHGRLNFDLYTYINREFKLDSYSMDSVAEHFLSETV